MQPETIIVTVKFHRDGSVTRDGEHVGTWARPRFKGDGYRYFSRLGGSIAKPFQSELIPTIEKDRHREIGASRMKLPRKPLDKI